MLIATRLKFESCTRRLRRFSVLFFCTLDIFRCTRGYAGYPVNPCVRRSDHEKDISGCPCLVRLHRVHLHRCIASPRSVPVRACRSARIPYIHAYAQRSFCSAPSSCGLHAQLRFVRSTLFCAVHVLWQSKHATVLYM